MALKFRVAIGTAVVEEHIEAAPDREAFEKGLKEGVSVRAAIKGHEEDPSVWRAAVVTNGPDRDRELTIRWDDDDQEGKTPDRDRSYFKPSQLAPRFGALRHDHVSSLRITSPAVVGDGTLHEALKGADGRWSVPEVLLRSPVATTTDFTVGDAVRVRRGDFDEAPKGTVIQKTPASSFHSDTSAAAQQQMSYSYVVEFPEGTPGARAEARTPSAP